MSAPSTSSSASTANGSGAKASSPRGRRPVLAIAVDAATSASLESMRDVYGSSVATSAIIRRAIALLEETLELASDAERRRESVLILRFEMDRGTREREQEREERENAKRRAAANSASNASGRAGR